MRAFNVATSPVTSDGGLKAAFQTLGQGGIAQRLIMVIRWPQGREHGANLVAEELRRENLPIPAHHGGQSKHGEREPNKQLIKCALDCARAWGRCASPLLSSVMFVPLRAGYDIANQGVKKLPGAEIGGRASSDRAVGVDQKTLGPSGARPNSVPPPRSLPG